MNLFKQDPDPLDALHEAQEAAQEAHTALEEARTARTAREARLKALADRVAEAEAEAERTALLPGGGTATATATRQVQEIEAEIQELNAEEERARDAHEAAKAEVRRIARDLVPDLAEDLAAARREKIRTLADLGKAVLKAVGEAEAEGAEERQARERFQEALHAAKPKSTQRRELERFLEAPAREAGPEAEVGLLVRRLLEWYSRADRDDIREVLQGYGIEPRRGTILFGAGSTGSPPITRALAFRIHEGTPLNF